ncbi:MAG: response regulator transcription factor [Gammaproteobacteria bacterium]|nr:response regulator transcription factor [Gammaproteobacteria bacterium]
MIVEDDRLFLNRLCSLIRENPDFQLFATAQNGVSAHNSLACGEPDVLLVDLGLPDLSGIEVIQYAAKTYPNLDIMVITIYDDQQQVLNCIKSGATGYMLKDSLDHEFISAIKQLRMGGSPISPLIARLLLRKLCPPTLVKPEWDDEQPKLSPRESEILTLLAKGLSYVEIACLLEISPHTVTATIKNIYRKLAVHSRGEAVYEASRMGLIC